MAAWLAAAAIVQLYGQQRANEDQAEAEELNRREYLAQKEISAMAARREADIFLTESDAFIGEQISALAKSGVQMDASSLMEIAKNKGAAAREYAAIQVGAAARARMFDLRASQAGSMAKRVRSSTNIQALGTLLNVGADATRANARQKQYDSPDGAFSGPNTTMRD